MTSQIYMFRSPQNTPADGWASADMAIAVMWEAKSLIKALEKRGWWEGTAEAYEAWYAAKGQPRLAGDLDGDGDVDAEDKKLADKFNKQAVADEAFVAEAVAEGRLAKPGSKKRAPRKKKAEEAPKA